MNYVFLEIFLLYLQSVILVIALARNLHAVYIFLIDTACRTSPTLLGRLYELFLNVHEWRLLNVPFKTQLAAANWKLLAPLDEVWL